jgi:hypothetical protein
MEITEHLASGQEVSNKMNMSRSSIPMVCLVSIVLIFCSGGQKDPYPEFTIPIYKGASDISTGFDNSTYGKHAKFLVDESFPATGVKQFYEDFLTKNGFSELKNYPGTDKTWVQYNSQSMKWDLMADSPPARNCRAWVDSYQTLIFKLKLDYAVEDKLSVACFLRPYTRENHFDRFEKWIGKMGKEKAFAEFVTKYSSDSQKVDTERALKENPDNELIKRFAAAVEQDQRDNEAAYKAYKETINSK